MIGVRTMTTDQIKNDIATTVRQWPQGVPPEQDDRMKALYGELRRRGQDVLTVQQQAQPQQAAAVASDAALADCSDEALQKELVGLSDRIARGDSAAQDRFADIRYEIRKRDKARPSSIAARQIEFDSEQPQVAQAAPQTAQSENGYSTNKRDWGVQQPQNGKSLLTSFEEVEQRQNRLIYAQIAAKVSGDLLTAQTSALGQINGDDIQTACEIGLRITETVFKQLSIKTE